MPKTIEDKFKAARFRMQMLRHTDAHFRGEHLERIRLRHAESLERLRVIPLGTGLAPEIRFLRRDRA